MPYSEHADGVHHGEHEIAIFNKDKRKVVAHVTGPSKDAALAKAKKVERLREMFKHMKGG